MYLLYFYRKHDSLSSLKGFTEFSSLTVSQLNALKKQYKLATQ